jgi:hypothetical protein
MTPPSSSHLNHPPAETIREWDDLLRAGGSIPSTDENLSYVLAVVRRLNGLGVDSSSPIGVEARAYVDEVLG